MVLPRVRMAKNVNKNEQWKRNRVADWCSPDQGKDHIHDVPGCRDILIFDSLTHAEGRETIRSGASGHSSGYPVRDGFMRRALFSLWNHFYWKMPLNSLYRRPQTIGGRGKRRCRNYDVGWRLLNTSLFQELSVQNVRNFPDVIISELVIGRQWDIARQRFLHQFFNKNLSNLERWNKRDFWFSMQRFPSWNASWMREQ